MSDLMLNIVNVPQNVPKQVKEKVRIEEQIKAWFYLQKHTFQGINERFSNGRKSKGSGFNFQFSNKPVSKAVVVRRKVIKPSAPVATKVTPKVDDIVINTTQNVVKSPLKINEKKEMKPAESGNLKKPLKRLNDGPKKVLQKGQKSDGSKKVLQKGQKSLKMKGKQVKSYLFDRVELPELGKSRVEPVREGVFSGTKIEALSIHPYQIKNIEEVLEFKELTKIQSKSIPVALEGKDILLRSQTGSGKTLCYAIPVIEKLSRIQPKISRGDGIYALVVVPTRELALQSYELFVKLVKPFTWIVPGYFSGGEKRKSEKARLRNGINILIGTPGRLCDHLLNTEALKLQKVQFLILDEADRLFELGYEKDVRNIVDALKAQKGDEGVQTMMLSATLTAAVKELAGLTLVNPTFVDCQNTGTVDDYLASEATEELDFAVIPSTVTQSYIIVPPKLRLVTLSGLIAHEIHRKNRKLLIFMSTQDLIDYHYDIMVEILAREKSTHEKDDLKFDDDDEDLLGLESDDDEEDTEDGLLPGLKFFKLHGSMTQVERSSVFKEFREVKTGVLLCTVS